MKRDKYLWALFFLIAGVALVTRVVTIETDIDLQPRVFDERHHEELRRIVGVEDLEERVRLLEEFIYESEDDAR